MGWKGWVAVPPSQDVEFVPCQAVLVGEGWEREQPCSFPFTTTTPLQLWSHLPYSCYTLLLKCLEGMTGSTQSPAQATLWLSVSLRAGCTFFVISGFSVDNTVRMRKTLNSNFYLILLCFLSGTRRNFILRLFFLSSIFFFPGLFFFLFFPLSHIAIFACRLSLC